MRLKCVVCVFLLCSSFAVAQIRDYVCIVRPVYSGEMREILLTTAKKASMLGYRDLGRVINSKSEPGFGSGFLISDADGTMYVVTNRHVIADADKATLEFERSDGAGKTIDNCAVVAISTELDLALISVGSAAGLPKGLSFAMRRTRDGEEIWSAGYPGLGDKPSWQLGKGTVTNQAARVPDLVDSAVSTLIQHSAPVDPGNSGGPLLVVNTSRSAGYDVVGINTWKAFFRQATNFAVPSSEISGFVSQVNKGALVSAVGLQKRADFFASVMSSKSADDDARVTRIRKISHLMSTEMVFRDGQDALFDALASAPTALRSEILQIAVNSSVFDAMRFSSAWRMDDVLSSLETPLIISRVPEAVSESAGAEDKTVRYIINDDRGLVVRWKPSLTEWVIAEYAIDGEPAESTNTVSKSSFKRKRKSSGSKRISFESPHDFSMNFEYSRREDFSFYGISYGSPSTYFQWGLGGSLGINHNESAEDPMFFVADAFEMFVALRVQLPVRMDSFTIIPYISGRCGMILYATGDDSSTFQITPVIGAEAVFGPGPFFIIRGGWMPRFEATNADLSGFLITAGIGL